MRVWLVTSLSGWAELSRWRWLYLADLCGGQQVSLGVGSEGSGACPSVGHLLQLWTGGRHVDWLTIYWSLFLHWEKTGACPGSSNAYTVQPNVLWYQVSVLWKLAYIFISHLWKMHLFSFIAQNYFSAGPAMQSTLEGGERWAECGEYVQHVECTLLYIIPIFVVRSDLITWSPVT